MKSINIINIRLSSVNGELALFNCEDSITGVIHTTRHGTTTIVLDGGYVLGRFGCPHVALDKLSDLHIKLHDADKESGTYAEYKKNMVGTVVH